jgi:hypothetical protein
VMQFFRLSVCVVLVLVFRLFLVCLFVYLFVVFFSSIVKR